MAVSEKSLANLEKRRSFTSEDGRASAAAYKSAEARRMKAVAAKELHKMAELLFKEMSLKDFQAEVMKDKSSQARRIFAMNASNPASAMATVNWLYNRLLGKPKQVTETTMDANVVIKKPTIVFKDTEEKE